MTHKETIDEAVHTSIEKLIEDLKEEFQLKTGDISFSQTELLEQAEEVLSKVMLTWVTENMPKKLKPLFDSMRGD